MKKTTATIIVFAVALFMLSMLVYIFSKEKQKYTADIIYENPVFELTGSAYEIPKQYEVIAFVFFNTDCGYCSDEAENISDNYTKLKNTLVLFVSDEDPKSIKEYSKKYPNLKFLSDKNSKLSGVLNITNYPTTFIIFSQNNTVKKHRGLINYKQLIPYE